MWSIILTLGVGVLIGATVNFKEEHMKINSKLQHLGVVALLFFMGISIGLNKELIHQLGQIGAKAFVYAGVTSLVSIILVYMVTQLILRRSHDT